MDAPVSELHEKIRALRAAADDLAASGEDIPAVARNTARIRASIKMLEMGICDLFELGVLEGERQRASNRA